MQRRRVEETRGRKGAITRNSESKKIIKNQPGIGMNHWKKAKVPTVPKLFLRDIPGSSDPLATETETVSIASLTPSRMLFRIKDGYMVTKYLQ